MKVEYIGFHEDHNVYHTRKFKDMNWGIHPVMFGNRIRVWNENDGGWCTRDYCLGLDLLWHNVCYNVVYHCLVNDEPLPEQPDLKPNFNDEKWREDMMGIFNKIDKDMLVKITATDIENIRNNEGSRIQEIFDNLRDQ